MGTRRKGQICRPVSAGIGGPLGEEARTIHVVNQNFQRAGIYTRSGRLACSRRVLVSNLKMRLWVVDRDGQVYLQHWRRVILVYAAQVNAQEGAWLARKCNGQSALWCKVHIAIQREDVLIKI